MKKLLCVLLLVAGCSCSVPLLKYPLIFNESKYQDLRDYNYRLYEFMNGPACSGTAIKSNEAETYILTADHCVRGKDHGMLIENIFVKLNGHFHVFRVAAYDEYVDLAVVVSVNRFPKVPVARISNHVPAVGDTLYTAGNPRQLENSIIPGMLISNLEKNRSGEYQYAISAQYLPGISGGGVYNGQHELVGVATEYLKDPGWGFCVPLPLIYDFLERANIQ